MGKKFLYGAIVLCVFFSLASCAKKAESGGSASGGVTLTVWSFTDELDGMINKYYKPSHPDIKVEYSMTPTDQFTNKLNPVLQAG
ncbi:MAG: carbohydrate ABC transporter substrate-binding protein, partial [Treponema sp.]|nr:carbohydrate ABC transporter substrate-binding protein [Treponema sp.]